MASDSPRRSRTGRRTRKYGREFDPDYSYVKKDLRRIATLTGVLLTILLILALILR